MAIGDDSGDFLIQILYPFQDFDRYTLGYQASAPRVGDGQHHRPPALPAGEPARAGQRHLHRHRADLRLRAGSSDIQIDSLNFTDLETTGFRGEVTKIVGDQNLLTYGGSTTRTTPSTPTSRPPPRPSARLLPVRPRLHPARRHPFFFFECAFVDTDDVANTPNATNTGYGVFVQDEIRLGDDFSATLGLRYAKTETKAEPTPGLDISGLDFCDDAVVGASNLTYSITPNLKLVASYGTAFRAPSIIERLFNGLTPEGSGFQILNPDLMSEESDNIDLGLKYRSRRAFFEAIYFDTEIDDAIIQHTLTDDEIAAAADGRPGRDRPGRRRRSWSSSATPTCSRSTASSSPAATASTTASPSAATTPTSRARAESGGRRPIPPATPSPTSGTPIVRYELVGVREFWVEYRIRHNGEEDLDVDPDAAGPPRRRAAVVHRPPGGRRPDSSTTTRPGPPAQPASSTTSPTSSTPSSRTPPSSAPSRSGASSSPTT